ncbi:MAG: glycerophosphodiester phosphodiesterase [Gammaproteobacteria bacterium]|nr:glycerophosphodiester phosphodiesterase [Gammaproteobacteria bacterium]MYJ53189.1 glycerophosphodiester phosphodiesterase [Gammaproteobacteria bacterium]
MARRERSLARIPHNASGSNRFPRIHGHRGARGVRPENTLESILAAVRLGCDAVEVDLWISADDRLIVHHDPRISRAIARGPDGTWVADGPPIRGCSTADLKRYDVGRMNPGSRYAARFPDQVPCDGSRIPTLAEVARLLDGLDTDIELNLELKSAPGNRSLMPPAERVIDIAARELETLRIVDRAFVQSFDWRLPLGVKSRLPDVRIGLLSDQNGEFGIPAGQTGGGSDGKISKARIRQEDLPERVHELGAEVWSPNALDIDADTLETARRAGLEVCVWTVNSERDMLDMLDLGVDAITTDYPERLIALRAERNDPGPPG